MNPHEECIGKLYTAFQRRDAEAMMTCYHDKATFQDPVFTLTSKADIRAMWTMLCRNAKEFELSFRDIQADDETGWAHWEATYLFSSTNRKVHNVIEATFHFKDGLIIQHTDHFNFYSWSRQAFGLPGVLLGWSSVFRKKVQQGAQVNLRNHKKA